MQEVQEGQLYAVAYKSGEYVGEFVERSANSPRAVVQIKAVLRHPEQGDLHHPYEADVPLFHQRKASAYGEYVLVPLQALRPYAGDVPGYAESLAAAWRRQYGELAERGDAWAERSLLELEQLRREYGFSEPSPEA